MLNTGITHLIGTILWWLYVASVAGCCIVVLSENRNPIRSLAWVVALIFFPIGGLVCYLFFGRSLKGMRMISKRNKRKLRHASAARKVKLDSLTLPEDRRQIAKLAYTLSKSPLTVNNSINIYTDGVTKFESLMTDLRLARHSIYLQYYIFANDDLGQRIAGILKEKAAAGLDVRVIYDHVGSFSTSGRFFREMRQAGVKVHPFFRVTFPQLANRINWRNHRKLVIIDRQTGYIGGMNIADRYLHGTTDNPVWRDTHFRVSGDIVESLLYSFIIDWGFMSHQLMEPVPPSPPRPQLCNDTGMQLVASGPVDPHDNLSLCFLRAISSARKSIYIQTPYFLPTDALQHALEAAALAKVDVRIMIPAKSDSRLLRLASFSYISQCLKAGIKVYLYRPGMLHAKAMVIDDDFVTAGSTNFDFRSLENNFECNLLIYDESVNKEMRDIFFSDIALCDKLTYSRWHSRPLPQRLFESLVRLLSPIL